MSRATLSYSAAAAFDRVADSYDELFTHSAVGRAQRKQVWARLISAFEPGQRVLELNCGTGVDARFLAEKGRTVVACDASSAMIEVARRRVQAEVSPRNLRFVHLANEDLDLMPRRPLFDGAFSNFSGLNCLADLKPVAANLAELVRPGGNVLLCVWSRVCVSELLWYASRGQFKKACRRLSGKATARVADVSVSVSYPTVSQLRRAFAPWFELRARRAIGLFVPPSYVEPSIRDRKKTLSLMEQLDRHCAEWPVFRDMGDHVLLEFTRCNQ
jgi:ubiquinone/menaquinone biosynthesis C-methylase UbiE